MKKILKWMDENLEKSIAIALMSAMTIILFIQVICRRVFNSSLTWSEELARYMFVWLVYIAISLGAKHMAHLKVEAFLGIFPKKIRAFIQIAAEIVVLLFAVIIVYYGFGLVGKQMGIGQISPAMGIPMWIVYLAPPIGFLLTIIRQIQVIIYRIRHRDSIDQNETEDGTEEDNR